MWAEKRAKIQNSAGRISKTGTFQTAGAAQPMELSKKRRHFWRDFLKIFEISFIQKVGWGHRWAGKLRQSRVNLQILPAGFFVL